MEHLFDTALPPVPRPGILRFALTAMLIPLALLYVTLWVGSEYDRGRGARGRLERSYQRRIAVVDLIDNVRIAEIGRRYYRMTGDARALSDYRQAVAAIDRNQERMERLLIAVPRQTDRYRQLIRIVDAEWDWPVRPQEADGPSRSVPLGAAERVAGAFMAEEDSMIATRVSQWNARAENVRRLVWVMLTMTIGGYVVVVVATWAARQSRYRLERDRQDASVRMRAVFTNASDGIVLVDPNGMIEAVNPAIETMLDRDVADLVGRDLSVLVDLLPPGATLAERLEITDGRVAEPLRINRAAYYRDGRSVPVDVALGLMPLADGLHMVAAIRDVSERSAVAKLKQEFVVTVSHELRTPLTSIAGALGLLRTVPGYDIASATGRLVQIAENNSRRLIRLVNDLIDIERIDSGRMPFRRGLIDLAVVVRRAVEGSETLAVERGVRIDSRIAPGRIYVRGDSDRLLQVLTNLLANAIRFSPPGYPVTVSLDRDGDSACVTVEDKGPGVPTAFRDRLFTRFAQAGDGTASGGTGLGLAISHDIVAAHGGRIWFEAPADGGARFLFAIARMKDPAPVTLAKSPA